MFVRPTNTFVLVRYITSLVQYFVTDTDIVSGCVQVCASVLYVSAKCVLSWAIGMHIDEEKRWICLSQTTAEPRSYKTSHSLVRIQQYSSSRAVAVQPQPCSKLSPLRQSRCTCVLLVHSSRRRSNHHNTTTFSRPMQQYNTHRRTSYQVYEAHSSSKKNADHRLHIIVKAAFPLFDLRRSRGNKSTPS